MEVVSHMCDICKQTKTKEELANLELCQGYGSKIKMISNRIKLDICPDCLEKRGIVIKKPENQTQEEIYQKNEKTFKEKFIELLNDLDVSFYE